MHRSLRPIAVVMALVPAVALAAWLLAPPALRAAESKDEKPKEEKATLKAVMEDLGGSFKRLRRQVTSADQNESTLAILLTMEAGIVKAKSFVPPQIAAMPKEKQADALRTFRLKMIDLLTATLGAEKAVLEGRNGDAFAIAKKLEVMKDECHKPLRVGE